MLSKALTVLRAHKKSTPMKAFLSQLELLCNENSEGWKDEWVPHTVEILLDMRDITPDSMLAKVSKLIIDKSPELKQYTDNSYLPDFAKGTKSVVSSDNAATLPNKGLLQSVLFHTLWGNQGLK